ncbi:MAG: 50S ribosomal protein L21 [Clostridiales bacterium GWF2_38_85]|nr:MAG: 50S ribosomal protein L21 [Clostridiales bacterium GWF2_38_85]HBL83728.1 50S ribosomal protein L21 [Clostridiales bacterium]
MYAVVETGGKQYKVCEGDIIFVEKLPANSGDSYTFDKVLAVSKADGFVVGNPTVADCTVTANVVKNGKSKKIHIIRYKSKKNEKTHMGHRQPYTKLQIMSIQA